MASSSLQSKYNHPPPPETRQALQDSRSYFDKSSGRWRYEDDDGDEWEWQETILLSKQAQVTEQADIDSKIASSSSSSSAANVKGHWVKVVDDELIQAQQQAYNVAGINQDEPANPVLLRLNKKRKQPSDSIPPSKKPKPITSLYVTGLPLDCTVEEIASVFSRYGLLLEDDHGNPRIKMYHDQATNQFKGEALVVYFKPESVQLAIRLLDDTFLRAAIGQTSGPTMKVQLAHFVNTSTNQQQETQQQQQQQQQQTSSHSNNTAPTDSQSSSLSSRRNLTDQERKKIAKRVAKMETKLADWSSSDEDTLPQLSSNTASHPSATSRRTVILKKMFTLIELEEDPSLLLDLKQDVREECESGIGKVTNVTLWDKEPEGIITVKFANSQDAIKCVQKMDARFFATRRIVAFLADTDKPKFRKTDNKDDDDEEEEEKRAQSFGVWLESVEDKQ